jgi:regulator of replication initiation timing
MAELEIQLKRIQDKLQLLLKEHASLQKENALLKDQLGNSEKQAGVLHQNIDALKQQVDVLKLSNGEMSETDKKQFEKRINGYLKEIDRAIALLSE